MRKAILWSIVFIAACGSRAGNIAGDAMMDAGEVLTEAGSEMRDALGLPEAEASVDSAVPQDTAVDVQTDAQSDSQVVVADSGGDGATGGTTRTVLTSSCDQLSTITQVNDADPDVTLVQDAWFAEFDVPDLDPLDPPLMAVWTCDFESFGPGVDWVSQGPPCTADWTCSSSGTRPPAGCSEGLVSRIAPGKAWVSCGSRQRFTDADGLESSLQGTRWATVRLVVSGTTQ